MAALNFPNPSIQTVYYAAGRTWEWDGVSWNSVVSEQGGGTTPPTELPDPILWEPNRDSPTLTISGSQTNLFRLGSTSETIVDLGTLGTAGTITLDPKTASNFRCALGETITFVFSSPLVYDSAPTISTISSITVYMTQAGGGSPVWPANVLWDGGTAPGITAIVGAIDIFTFVTYDGGQNWLGLLQARGLR
jgi:hypothetical protein